MRPICLLFAVTASLLAVLHYGQAMAKPDVARRYAAASVLVSAAAECRLGGEDAGEKASGIRVIANQDGFARFWVARAKPSDAVTHLTLHCQDAAGKLSSRSVDLTSDELFTPRPLNLADEAGQDRPALRGDAMSYSQEYLLKAGYGLRPDPAQNAVSYGKWLAAASRPGRLLAMTQTSGSSRSVAPAIPDSTVVTPLQRPYWVGPVLLGAPSYVAVNGFTVVPTALPGGDETTTSAVSIWNGVGGFGGSGLIQGGFQIETTASSAVYFMFREYCCGGAPAAAINFPVSPGDEILSQEWYCDASGNINLNGGFGCSYLENLRTGAIASCTLATNSPCTSLAALPLCSVSPLISNCMVLGGSAEFIVEYTSPQLPQPSSAFTDFTPTMMMTGEAYSTTTQRFTQSVNTDPQVDLLTDFTDSVTRISVTLGTASESYFTISPTYGTIWKFDDPCAPLCLPNNGPCTEICDGWTVLDDNPLTVALAASGSRLYQLHSDGTIWLANGTPCSVNYCPGWSKVDADKLTTKIRADGNNLYKLRSDGSLWRKMPLGVCIAFNNCPAWAMLDQNPAILNVTASGGHVYELHQNGEIWMWTDVVCTGSSCPGWIRLDANPATDSIVADNNDLYQLHDDGSIWQTTCASSCTAWIRLDDNPDTAMIAASNGNLYQLHFSGEIWEATGVACNGNSCPGWIRIDDNPAANEIVADQYNLFQKHNDGSLWSWVGIPCSGNSCPGWTLLDANPLTADFVAGGGSLYQMRGW